VTPTLTQPREEEIEMSVTAVNAPVLEEAAQAFDAANNAGTSNTLTP
jgi:hypothetical protein